MFDCVVLCDIWLVCVPFQCTQGLNIKAHRIGTRGFRAPEVGMMQEYNEKCDIFSIGVILFVMLTNEMPFRRTTCKIRNSNEYVLDPLYKVFCKQTDPSYWIKHVAFSPLIPQNAKTLMHLMLKPKHQDRISIQQIKKHQFYNSIDIFQDRTTVDNKEQLQLKHDIESLINQSKDNINTKYMRDAYDDDEKSQASQSSNLGDDIVDKESLIPIATSHCVRLPFWVPENLHDKFYFSTSNRRSIFDAFINYVENELNGIAHYYTKSQTLHCQTKNNKQSGTDLAITVYKSHKWNHLRNMLRLQSKINQIGYISTIYSILIHNVQGSEEQFHHVKNQMMQHFAIQKIITGIPPELIALGSTKKTWNSPSNVKVNVNVNSVELTDYVTRDTTNKRTTEKVSETKLYFLLSWNW